MSESKGESKVEEEASFTVAEDGNRKKTSVVSTKESEQCALDVVSWFLSKGGLLSDVGPAGDDAEERLASTTGSAVPASLSFLLARHNGGIWFREMRLLSVEEILAAVDGIPKGALPVAADLDENLLVVLETGEVVEWDIDEKTAGETLASTFDNFVEDYRNELLAGRYEFVEGQWARVRAGASPRAHPCA